MKNPSIPFIRKPTTVYDPELQRDVHTFTASEAISRWILETGQEVIHSLMHGRDWDGQRDVSNWWLSEKYNGCRAVWWGGEFWTRSGLFISAPTWFKRGIPTEVPLEGELIHGRGRSASDFEKARLACQCGKFTRQITFRPFDIPENFFRLEDSIERIAELRLPKHVRPVKFRRVSGATEALAILSRIVAKGGEGLMLRKPDSEYKAGRTPNLLKLKP